MAALKGQEHQQAEERKAIRAKVIHEAIRRDGEEEMRRGPSALAWSALAAGLSIGISLLAQALLRHHVPDVQWEPLVTRLGYSIGFIIVIVGRQQLFTENTLTPILPLMHQPALALFRRVAMLWTVVFLGNMVGGHIISWALASTPILKPEFHQALSAVAHEVLEPDFQTALIRGIPAGWLIATIVWMRAASDGGSLAIIVVLTWLVALGGFTHIVAGSVEYLYLVFRGEALWTRWVTGYMLPVLIGNIIGGVSLTAALNHAQVVSEQE